MSITKGRQERQEEINISEPTALFVHSVIDDYPLSAEEFRVIAHVVRRAGTGTAYSSIDSMAKTCRMHPDTVRRCLQNLRAYKMVESKERRGQTTLYTPTKPSKWVKPDVVLAVQKQLTVASKAKRALKKVTKQESPADPSEMEGGVQTRVSKCPPVKQREGYPSEMKGGHLSEREGDEGNPLRDSIEGYPSSREDELEGATGNGPDDDLSANAGKTKDLPVRTNLEGSEDSPPSGSDGAQVDGTKLESATSTEQVPPAAAGLAGLQPIPRAVLEARPARDPECMTTLRKMLSASNKSRLEYLHNELAGATYSGIPMMLATRLTDEELVRARDAASFETHTAGAKDKVSYPLACRRGVERLIGEMHRPISPRGAAVQVLNAGQTPRIEPEPERPTHTIEVGTRWKPKDMEDQLAQGKKIEDLIVTIVKVDRAMLTLDTGETLYSYMLMCGYEWAD